MSVEQLQANLPLVTETGHMTQISTQALQKLIREVIALRTLVTDHETRITTLEP